MTPLVIAHRGSSWDVAENTLPAFERAIELGADYVELDVHATRGGRLVVTHERPSAASTYPTLEEALDLMHGRVGVMVELKAPARYRRHDMIRRALGLAPLVYTVNDETRMRELAAIGVEGVFTDRPERALRLFAAPACP